MLLAELLDDLVLYDGRRWSVLIYQTGCSALGGWAFDIHPSFNVAESPSLRDKRARLSSSYTMFVKVIIHLQDHHSYSIQVSGLSSSSSSSYTPPTLPDTFRLKIQLQHAPILYRATSRVDKKLTMRLRLRGRDLPNAVVIGQELTTTSTLRQLKTDIQHNTKIPTHQQLCMMLMMLHHEWPSRC